jgi:hypothetical protein
LEESFALIRGALELVATTDSPVLRANTVLDHARILAASGQREEATQQAGLALDLFVQKGHVLATRWAEALLSELGQAPTEAVRRPPTIAPGTANQEPVTAPTS